MNSTMNNRHEPDKDDLAAIKHLLVLCMITSGMMCSCRMHLCPAARRTKPEATC